MNNKTDLNSINSMMTKGARDSRLESEVFYLIIRHLRSYTELRGSANELEAKLLELGAFGTSHDWSGQSKQLTMGDFDKKYPMVPENQLIQLLAETKCEDGSRRSSSLLRVNGIYDPSNADQRTLFTELSKKLAQLLIRLHETSNSIKKARDLKNSIENRLNNNFADEFSENGGVVVDLTLDLSHDDLDLTNDVVLHLKHIGSSKHVSRLVGQIDEFDRSIAQLRSQIREVAVQLTTRGYNLTSKNHLECTISMLRAREHGVMSLLSGSRGYRGTALVPSGLAVRDRLLNNYQLHFTISGHMTNPSYCCVFDRSGDFLITGADDWLVKIWDVNKGILVKTCRGHQSYISFIVVSPDNSIFASACTMGTIRIWSLRDGLCLSVFHHKSSVNWMKFDPASCTLVSGSDDGYCKVWDLSKFLSPDCVAVPLLDKVLLTKQYRVSNSDLVLPSRPHQPSSDISRGGNQPHEDANEVDNVVYRPFSGLFHWSREVSPTSGMVPAPISVAGNNNDSPNALSFPHVNEHLPILSAQNEPRKVRCLDLSSVGNLIATGCEDGVARIWKFGSPFEDDLSENNKYPLRHQKRHLESTLLKLKDSCNAADKPTWDKFAKHLLLRLEGHAHPITDIHFNSLGDRILTGSEKGGVRIWSFSKDYMESVQIVLNLSEEDEQQPLMVGRAGVRRNSNRSALIVHNVCWTCDDLRVVTLLSVPRSNSAGESKLGTRLKVWDSMTGDLLRIIRTISDGPANCLARHPFNPHIAVTAGEDGIVNVWHIDNEEHMSRTQIEIMVDEQSKRVEVLDISLSPDGSRIAATDNHGRLTVIGLDNPMKYANVLSEQYYSTDYMEVILDNQGYAIDVGTQLPADRAPSGPLCSLHQIVHPIQPRITHRPQTLRDAEVEELIQKIIADRQKLPSELDRVFSIFKHNKRNPKKYGARTAGNLITMTASPNGRGEMKATLPSNSTSNIRYIEFDELTSSDSDDDHSGRRANQSNRGRRSNGRSNVHTLRDLVRRTASNGNAATRRSYRNRQQYSSLDDSFLDEEEHFGSSSTSHIPTRAERAAARAAVRDGNRVRETTRIHALSDGSEFEIEDEEDEDETNSDMEYSEHGDNEPRRRSARERNKSRREPQESEEDESISESEDSDARERANRASKAASNRRESFQRREPGLGSKSNRGRRRQGGPEGTELMGLELDRSWLQQDAPNEYVYSPQVGDIVIYFPQGHKEQLTHFTESSSPPWVAFGQKFPLYECMVQDIAFEFPTEQEFCKCKSAVAKVTLVVLRVPSRTTLTSHGNYLVNMIEMRSTRHSINKTFSFEVKLRNSGLADFVIPSSIFHRSISWAWHQGIEIVVKFSECDENGESVLRDYFGKVLSLSNSDEEWPHSPWEALEVIWENSGSSSSSAGGAPPETQRISPWDAIPRYPSSSSTTSGPALPKLNEQLCSQIESAIGQLLKDKGDRYSPFEYEVDSTVFPHYYSLIAVPSFVDLIRRRLLSGYYRQIAALEWDINLLYLNCEIFNQQGSDIVAAAGELRDDLVGIVRAVHESPSSSSAAIVAESSSVQRNNAMRNSRKAQRSAETKDVVLSNREDLGELKLRFKRQKVETHPPLTLHISSNAGRLMSSTTTLEEPTRNSSGSKRRSNLDSSDESSDNYNSQKEGDEESENIDGEQSSDDNDDAEESLASQRKRFGAIDTRSGKPSSLVLRIPSRKKSRAGTHQERDSEGHEDKEVETEEEHLCRRSTRRSVGERETTNNSARSSSQHRQISLNKDIQSRTRSANNRSTRSRREVSYAEQSSEEESEDDQEQEESPTVVSKRQPSGKVRNPNNRTITQPEFSTSIGVRKNSRLDPEVRRHMLDVVEFATDLDKKFQWFSDPVDPEEAPNYYEIIETPMDFSLIRSNITSRRYENVHEIIRDVLLIYSNCELYNDPNSDIVKDSRRQQRFFKQYVRTTYPKEGN